MLSNVKKRQISPQIIQGQSPFAGDVLLSAVRELCLVLV